VNYQPKAAMNIQSKLQAIEKRLKAIRDANVSSQHATMLMARELAELCRMPKQDEVTEQNLKALAEDVIGLFMKDENPDEPHYPPAIATALAERYGFDLVKRALNEKHAVILRRAMGVKSGPI